MLKQLRDMNADTTSSAVATTAVAASASAAASAAANLPNIRNLKLDANDFVEQSILKKRTELKGFEDAEMEVKKTLKSPLPDHVRLWTCLDVCKWLETLSLHQYTAAFKEASVDGPFLMELREEDLTQILGVRHKLHVRKIMVSRKLLEPLTIEEMKKKKMFEEEEQSDQNRAVSGMVDLDTAFSQCRNGRTKRMEESLNTGFPIDAEDEKGDTLLLVACQNSHR
jgi:SAM domain (Sterile alpha motif)